MTQRSQTITTIFTYISIFYNYKCSKLYSELYDNANMPDFIDRWLLSWFLRIILSSMSWRISKSVSRPRKGNIGVTCLSSVTV